MIVSVELSILLADTVACIALSAVEVFLALCNIPGLCYGRTKCGELCLHVSILNVKDFFLLTYGGFVLIVGVLIQIVGNCVHFIGKPWWSSP